MVFGSESGLMTKFRILDGRLGLEDMLQARSSRVVDWVMD